MFVSQGLVLGKRGAGESNTLLSVLTSELGLVRVSARSTRLEVSKLRYGLEALTEARFSFVRGRHDWKLTGVERISREYVAPSTRRRQQSGKVARLLVRLIPGEDPVPGLYEAVTEGFHTLAQVKDDQDAEAVEWVLVLRILDRLGYLPERPQLGHFLSQPLASEEVIAEARASRQLLIRSINESLNATGL